MYAQTAPLQSPLIMILLVNRFNPQLYLRLRKHQVFLSLELCHHRSQHGISFFTLIIVSPALFLGLKHFLPVRSPGSRGNILRKFPNLIVGNKLKLSSLISIH
jgi:hypothetical protein